MEVKDFFHILKRRKGVIIYAWLIFIAIGAIATFSQPLKYEAKSRLLIVQNVSGVDPYTVSKSNQYLSSLFSQVVYSDSFFELVTSSNNFDIDRNYFSDNYKHQMKIWGKTIYAKSNDSGIIEISTYHPSAYQAKQIALGVNDVLINQGFNYQGGGDTVKVKIIDQPLVSDYPVKPNIAFNFIAFSFLGILAGLIYLYFRPYKKPSAKQIKKSQNINQNINAIPKSQFIFQDQVIEAIPARKQNYSQPIPTNSQHIAQTNQTPRVPQVPTQTYHPAEKVMINDRQQNNQNYQAQNHPDQTHPVRGDIKNVMNRF